MSKPAFSDKSLRVLLVEDHQDIAANICESYAMAGHIVDYAANANQALAQLEQSRYDLLVLDILLPGQNGVELCREIRERQLSGAPVLMLTARGQVDDKLEAFDAGADDYLTKPFSTRELLARSMVLSRRQRLDNESRLTVGPITIDTRERTVTRGDKSIALTRVGFRILLELLRESPGVVLRDDLEHALWGDDRPDSDALRTHMSVLRTALDKPFEVPMIQTVHGAGWKVVDPPSASRSTLE